VCADTSMTETLIGDGTVRLQPSLLTAGTTLLAAWYTMPDLIFNGLAWVLIFDPSVSAFLRWW